MNRVTPQRVIISNRPEDRVQIKREAFEKAIADHQWRITLEEFCRWYAGLHGATGITPSVMTTCMCGYFRTYTKAAEQLLKRCMELRLVVARGDTLTIVNNKYCK